MTAHIINRDAQGAKVGSVNGEYTIEGITQFESALSLIAFNTGLLGKAVNALRHIDVQLPFDTLSHWAARSQGNRVPPMRDSVTVAPSPQLERFGANLPNAYFSLRNESSSMQWDYTMELVRMGLGEWVESVNTRSDASGGKIGLWIKPRHTDVQISAASLSDGQLAYLAFVALTQLPSTRSILCFDELETHLHPRLLTKVLGLLEIVAEDVPVLVTTHSRRLLDALDRPAESVRVLELNPKTFYDIRKTVIQGVPAGGDSNLRKICQQDLKTLAVRNVRVFALYDEDKVARLVKLTGRPCRPLICERLSKGCEPAEKLEVVLLRRNAETAIEVIRDSGLTTIQEMVFAEALRKRRNSRNMRDRIFTCCARELAIDVRAQLLTRLPDIDRLVTRIVACLDQEAFHE